MTLFAVGQPMPPFEGRMTDGEAFSRFSLADALGQRPVVLAFFPLAFTSTCHEQLCDLRDNLAAFEALDARVFGVASDSAHALRAWHQQEGFGFPLVSDWNGEARAATGLAYAFPVAGCNGTVKRATVVLDAAGIVRYLWVGEDPDEVPPLGEIEAAVAAVG